MNGKTVKRSGPNCVDTTGDGKVDSHMAPLEDAETQRMRVELERMREEPLGMFDGFGGFGGLFDFGGHGHGHGGFFDGFFGSGVGRGPQRGGFLF